MIKYSRKTWMILVVLFVAVFSFTFLTQKFKGSEDAQAANAWAFDPGYIISDWQMGNYNAMSEADIQNFLTRMNPCNDRDYAKYQRESSNYPWKTWYWNASEGHFTCLSQERFGETWTEVGAGETAAHIIWQAAQDYHVNPQVLLVVLEKENGLITDTYPNSYNYRTAMGYGCPDGAPCEDEYFGFKKQVRKAAGLFHEVLSGGWTNYELGVNNIKYNPNAACGTVAVNIQNRATSALYRYTPYVPNNAALAAGYGTGDGCSSYGNRNFYMYFEDWFGGIKDEEYAMPASANISEGTYTIKSAIDTSKVMDVFDGSKANGSNVQIFSNNGTNAQKWQIKNNGDGTYTLINPQSNKALDVNGASKSRESNTQIYESNGTCAQKWRIANSGGDNYTIYSACSGMPLDVSGGASKNGTNIQIYAPNGTNAQKWKLEKEQPKVDNKNQSASTQSSITNGTYVIQSAINKNKVMDIYNGAESAVNGTNLQIFEYNGTNAQKWQFRQNSDGTYSVINPTNGKALDVFNGNTTNYTNIHVWSQNNTCAQKWKIIDNNDGTVTFNSTCSPLVLDVFNGNNVNGANIQLFTSNGTKAQRWILKKL